MVEQLFPSPPTVSEQRFSSPTTVVEQRFPHGHSAVEQDLPHGIMAAAQELLDQGSMVENGLLPSSVSGIMDEDIQCIEKGDRLSPTDSKHDGNTSIKNSALDCVHVIVYVEWGPQIGANTLKPRVHLATRLRLQAFQDSPGSNSYVNLRDEPWIRYALLPTRNFLC